MFTGLIEDVGTVERVSTRGTGLRLVVKTKAMNAAELALGESVSIDGYCQTVVETGASRFAVDVGQETLARTTAGHLKPGDRVNLERAMRMGDRLGGHLVAGHVDGVGRVRKVDRAADFWIFHIEAPPEVARYLIPKGSIAVQGVSLTVNGVEGATFTVGIIPHTAQKTTLAALAVGASVNLEADLIGKYVEKFFLAARGDAEKPGRLTLEDMAKQGLL